MLICVVGLSKYFTPWTCNLADSPSLEKVRLLSISTSLTTCNESLGVDSSSLHENVPVQFSSSYSKICWVCQHLASMLLGKKQRIFRKPNIVADTYPDVAELCLEYGKLRFTWFYKFTFGEHDVSRNVDIEEVLLSVLGFQVAEGVKAETSVKDLITTLNALGHCSSNNVRFSLNSQVAKKIIGLTSRSGWLFMLKHVWLHVRTCKHFGKHNHFSSLIAGFPNKFRSSFEVVRSVVEHLQLAKSHFERLGGIHESKILIYL